jgi:hypothetical protein
VPEGNGIRTYENGNKYIGMFSGGKQNGKGRLIMRDGSIMLGQFVNDEPDYVEFQFVGRGNKKPFRYIGKITEAGAQGLGEIHYANGQKYKGQFKNWLKHGKGTYYFDDKRKICGTYVNDNLEGV